VASAQLVQFFPNVDEFTCKRGELGFSTLLRQIAREDDDICPISRRRMARVFEPIGPVPTMTMIVMVGYPMVLVEV
jgi:hypothetical protein